MADEIPEPQIPQGAPVQAEDKTPAGVQTPPPEPPPAARTVLEGEITEDSVDLKKKLAEEAAGRRKAEIRAAELENENIELRKIPKPPGEPKKSSGWHPVIH